MSPLLLLSALLVAGAVGAAVFTVLTQLDDAGHYHPVAYESR